MDIWRRLPYHVGPTDEHIARGDALVRHCRQPTIWWHSTSHPTLILGAGQRNIGILGQGSSVLVVRRHAGGTAVYAGPGVLGLDVMLPAGHPLALDDVVETYRFLGEVWVQALTRLGIRGHLVTVAEVRESPQVPPAVAAACFGSLSPYEVTVDSRKLVGLSQVRRRNGVLLQAGIHRVFDADGLARLLDPNDAVLADSLRAAATGLDELAQSTNDDVIAAVEAALERYLDIRLEHGEWTEAEELNARP